MRRAEPLSTAKQANRQPVHTTSPVPQVNRNTATSYAMIHFLQRKTFCACDGGCPRCNESQPVQARLKIGEPDDIYEEEADRVADRVMRMPQPRLQRQVGEDSIPPLVQRQTEEEPEEEEEPVQAKAAAGKTAQAGPDMHGRIQSMRGGGQPLSRTERNYFEPRFGRDFSNVRIHTGGKASTAAASVNAKAFTVGRDIVFGSGQYSPGTSFGKHLLAHELTHTIQQGQGRRGQMRLQRKPQPCRGKHKTAVDSAVNTAANWVNAAWTWIETYIRLNQKRSELAKKRSASQKIGRFSIGLVIYKKMKVLQRHFKIFNAFSSRGFVVSRPFTRISSSYRASGEDFIIFANSVRPILANYYRLSNIKHITAYCQANCVKGRRGTDVAGNAKPGSNEYTIFTNCFTDRYYPHTRTGIVLHEAFHADNSEFNHDTYLKDSHYPGPKPFTNAESYAVFASVAATGKHYRMALMPAININVPRRRRP